MIEIHFQVGERILPETPARGRVQTSDPGSESSRVLSVDDSGNLGIGEARVGYFDTVDTDRGTVSIQSGARPGAQLKLPPGSYPEIKSCPKTGSHFVGPVISRRIERNGSVPGPSRVRRSTGFRQTDGSTREKCRVTVRQIGRPQPGFVSVFGHRRGAQLQRRTARLVRGELVEEGRTEENLRKPPCFNLHVIAGPLPFRMPSVKRIRQVGRYCQSVNRALQFVV